MDERLNFQFVPGLVNPCKEALALLVLRQVKEDFHDSGAIAGKARFGIHNGPIAFMLDVVLVQDFLGQRLCLQQLRMHANDQHSLMV